MVVAELDGKPLTGADLEAYFAINLLEEGQAAASPDEEARVLSRLFDNFLDERMLLAEAERAGVAVSDEEVDFYLGLGKEEDQPADRREVQREAVRHALMVQKFRDSFLRREVAVSPATVDAYLAKNRDRLLPQRQLLIRSLMLDSAEQADRVYREIRRRRMTFAEAVVAYGTAPGQGVPVEMSPDGLPEELQKAIEGLKPGQVSRPVELHGTTYLFQFDSWGGDRVAEAEDLRQRAEQELASRLRREAMERLMDELRGRTTLEVHRENLPFGYLPEEQGT